MTHLNLKFPEKHLQQHLVSTRLLQVRLMISLFYSYQEYSVFLRADTKAL